MAAIQRAAGFTNNSVKANTRYGMANNVDQAYVWRWPRRSPFNGANKGSTARTQISHGYPTIIQPSRLKATAIQSQRVSARAVGS